MSDLKIYFVRHGTTVLNQQGRFCGRCDALLAREGWQELYDLKEQYSYPEVERVYSSPAIRCLETASVLYPDMRPVVKEGLWEFDFGEEEETPVTHYLGTEFFDTWLNQEPDCAFRGGETLLEASFRICAAMTRIVKECEDEGISKIAVVAHGAILARLMDACLMPEQYKKEFMLCPNGMGVIGRIDTREWFTNQEIHFEEYFPKGAPRLKPEDSPYFRQNE